MNRKPLPLPLLVLITLGLLFGATWLAIGGAAHAQPATTTETQPATGTPAAADGAVPATINAAVPAADSSNLISLWDPLKSDRYALYEKILLCLNVVVALAGLGYALMLVGQVRNADQGTPRMQEIAHAVREGADAYLFRQFRVVGVLIVLITVALYFAAMSSATADAVANGNAAKIAWGRAIAFLIGSTFSATVGFVGMRLATVGNLRVAAAAQTSFGSALQLGYRTGTITGMLTDGLGLLGGSIIFLMYGEHAYEALLGFGFGGTLLALFMRVGGGIYTKAADVGADLVGKIEAGIPEDDPRNAATIADNVGDNVGDCAGMAADIFESYEVTIVAAMILGIASFGHKGVIFPLLVRAIGVIASIISTYSVKAGDKGTAGEAMKSVNRGFIIGSILSIVGFIVLGYFYLNFTPAYLARVSASYRRFSGQHCREYYGQCHGEFAHMGYVWRQRSRYASGLDLLDWNHSGGVAQQMHRVLHRYGVFAGERTRQGLPNRPRNQHHSRVCRRLRKYRGGGLNYCRGNHGQCAGLYRYIRHVCRVWRGHDRHRHAHAYRQHHFDGRLRPRGR